MAEEKLSDIMKRLQLENETPMAKKRRRRRAALAALRKQAQDAGSMADEVGEPDLSKADE